MTALDDNCRSLGREDGAALISALWLSLILALLALGLISAYRSSASIIRSDMQLKKLWLDADSVTLIAAYRLAQQSDGWLINKSYELRYNERDFKVFIRPSTAYLDLNLASENDFARLFIVLGYTPEEAYAKSARIADYRDNDDLIRINGAEKNEYSEAALTGPKNRPFDDLFELGSVLSLEPADVNCVAPYLTLFSGSRDLNSLARNGTFKGIPDFPSVPLTIIDGNVRRASIAGQVYEISVSTEFRDETAVQKSTIRFTGRANDPIWTHQIGRSIIERGTALSSQRAPHSCPIMEAQK